MNFAGTRWRIVECGDTQGFSVQMQSTAGVWQEVEWHRTLAAANTDLDNMLKVLRGIHSRVEKVVREEIE